LAEGAPHPIDQFHAAACRIVETTPDRSAQMGLQLWKLVDQEEPGDRLMFLDREIGFRDFTHHSDIWERLLTLTTFPPFHEMNFHKCWKLFQPQMPTIKVFI
jgi:hypothetical protein